MELIRTLSQGVAKQKGKAISRTIVGPSPQAMVGQANSADMEPRQSQTPEWNVDVQFAVQWTIGVLIL